MTALPLILAALSIVFDCVNETPCSVTGTLIVRSVGEPARIIEAPVANRAAAVDAAAANGWDVELRSATHWMPPQRLGASLRVWKTTRLLGRFSVDKDETLPASFNIELATPPGLPGQKLDTQKIACPVSADGTWECAIPATMLDVSLRIKGFIPQYYWDLDVTRTGPKNLGTIALRRGASIVAWLDRETVQSLKAPAQARLTRMVMQDSSEAGQRLLRPVVEASFNARGAVQLTAVPAGTYTLEVGAPGFAATRIDRIEVYERSESTLRHPITLTAPLSIDVRIIPPRDPSGASWQVDLRRKSAQTGQSTAAGHGTTDDLGSLHLDHQSAGRYFAVVRDSQKNVLARQEFTVDDQATAQKTIEIAFARAHGTVRFGGSPLEAVLVFGGRSGSERVKGQSNSRGEFDVKLPRAGKWRVDVDDAAADIHAMVEISVDRADAPILIEIPKTEITGVVLGSDARPVPDANLMVITPKGVIQAKSASDGTFVMRGVPEGSAAISATDKRTGERSEMKSVAILNGTPLRDLRLSMESARDMKGIVMCGGQPVIGARVTAQALNIPISRQERAVTGVDGRFNLALADDAPEFVLVAAAPGRTLQAYRTRAGDVPLTLDLAPSGGTLRIRTRNAEQGSILTYNGVNVPIGDVVTWARAHGQSVAPNELKVPNMAPGAYRFCAVSKDSRACRDGVLAPGATLDLDID